jgi:hypothetical protein
MRQAQKQAQKLERIQQQLKVERSNNKPGYSHSYSSGGFYSSCARIINPDDDLQW